MPDERRETARRPAGGRRGASRGHDDQGLTLGRCLAGRVGLRLGCCRHGLGIRCRNGFRVGLRLGGSLLGLLSLLELLANLRDFEFDAPQGRVRIDPENNHTYLWPRIARLDREGKFQIVWNPGVRVKPDPYCVVQSLDDWSTDDLQLIRP